jgi:hypothetical protein
VLTIQEVPFFELCVPQKSVQCHPESASHRCTHISTLDNHIQYKQTSSWESCWSLLKRNHGEAQADNHGEPAQAWNKKPLWHSKRWWKIENLQVKEDGNLRLLHFSSQRYTGNWEKLKHPRLALLHPKKQFKIHLRVRLHANRLTNPSAHRMCTTIYRDRDRETKDMCHRFTKRDREYTDWASRASYRQMVAGQEPIHVIYRKGNCQRPKIVILLHLVLINQHSNSRSYSMSEAAQALALFICGQCMQHLDYLLEIPQLLHYNKELFFVFCLQIIL